ncbi:hypothetical protein MPC1_14690002 [Methylocella tundrae]|nr:hypothetical protein MPC1_14690002 [Methylocella tundrae]
MSARMLDVRRRRSAAPFIGICASFAGKRAGLWGARQSISRAAACEQKRKRRIFSRCASSFIARPGKEQICYGGR